MRVIQVILLCSTVLLGATGSHATEVVTHTYQIQGFNRVVLSGHHELELSLGDFSVQVQGMQDGDTLISRDDNTLFLGKSQQGLYYDQPVKFRVSLPELERVTLRGSGRIFVRPVITNQALNFELQGSGSVYLHDGEFADLTFVLGGSGDVDASGIAAERLVVNIAGSGAVQIGTLRAASTLVSIGGSGDFGVIDDCVVVDDVTVNIAGSGDFNGETCAVDATSANIIGSGDVRIGSTGRVNANIVGSGNVYYRAADTTSASILGSGELKKID